MEGVTLQHSVRAQEQSLKKKYAWYPKGAKADMVYLSVYIMMLRSSSEVEN